MIYSETQIRENLISQGIHCEIDVSIFSITSLFGSDVKRRFVS